MQSNTEKGRKFQELCKRVLEAKLGRELLSESPITLPNGQTHKYDLTTSQKDIVAECKAYTWTESGNTPSAKITHLRESLQYLNAIQGPVIRHLIVKRDRHASRKETLCEYFVRLNGSYIGDVNVSELSEDGLDIRCLIGELDRSGSGQPASKPEQRINQIEVEALGRMRREIFKLLDLAEGIERRDEGPAKRVTRLRAEQKIPRSVANCLHTILGFRDSAEYKDHTPTDAESVAIRGAWEVILEWAEKNKYK